MKMSPRMGPISEAPVEMKINEDMKHVSEESQIVLDINTG